MTDISAHRPMLAASSRHREMGQRGRPRVHLDVVHNLVNPPPYRPHRCSARLAGVPPWDAPLDYLALNLAVGMNKVIEAKLRMYDALITMLNKGQWVGWPDGNQYFVIKPENFRELIEPYDRLLDAECC